MLEKMRDGAQHPIMKVFFLILAAMFVLWGVGDVFRGGGSATFVAKVGDSGVEEEELNRIVQSEVARYREVTGRTLSDEEIEELGIKNDILLKLLRDKMIIMRADEMRLISGTENIANAIQENSIFFDDDGKFDKKRFKRIINENGYTEERFIRTVRTEFATKTLKEAILAVSQVPNNMLTNVYKYQNEVRVADMITLPKSYITNLEDPSETDLVQFYQDNQNDFISPEQRSITYIKINIDTIKGNIKFTDKELRDVYQQNLPQYTTHEAMDVSQYLFTSMKDAEAAYKKLSAGKKIDDSKIELGRITRLGLPKDLSDQVFTLKENESSKPMQSQLGWHIFVVNKIVPSHVKPFEQVKKSIEDELFERRLSDEFAIFGEQIEDEFASGKTMQEVSEKFSLQLHNVPLLTSANDTTKDEKSESIPDPDILLPILFNMDVGVPSSLILLSDNSSYVVLQVDSITAKRVKALDEVKGIAINMWKERQKIEKLRQSADDLVATLREGKEIGSLARSMKLKLSSNIEIRRVDINQSEFPYMLERELFNLKKIGAYTGAYISENNDFIIAKLKEVIDANHIDDISGVQSLKLELENAIQSDIAEQYIQYLTKQYPVAIKSANLSDDQ